MRCLFQSLMKGHHHLDHHPVYVASTDPAMISPHSLAWHV
ncbi:hypothetical protein J500_1809 [Acinetobacter sp. 479375]|nr:hypothetical protein J500_1809 [Acinetobacter sp. 479375]